MSLAKLETDFMDCLLEQQQDEQQFIAELSTVMQLSPADQLAIYRSHLNGAHETTLQQVYPAIHRILGEGYFHQLARLYRIQYPSMHPDLNIYGEYFSEFLTQQIQLHDVLAEYCYLPDLARHEFSWHGCYFAKDSQLFDFAKFSAIQESNFDRLTFSVNPSLSIHKTDYPVIEIWQANQHNTDTAQSFNVPEDSVYYCIYRPVYQPEYAIIDQQQYKLMTCIIEGHSLAQLVIEYSHLLQESLLHFIERQWITGYQIME